MTIVRVRPKPPLPRGLVVDHWSEIPPHCAPQSRVVRDFLKKHWEDGGFEVVADGENRFLLRFTATAKAVPFANLILTGDNALGSDVDFFAI